MSNLSPNICYRLTRRCNLKCSFCFACKEQNDIDTNSVKKSIRILKTNGMESIRLSGGEPSLRLDLIEIINYCLQLKLEVILCSNLYSIDNILYDLIKLPISITTSIHGSEQYHNSITCVHSYKKILDTIKVLVNHGVEVNVHSVITKENYTHIDNMIADSLSWRIKKISFLTFIPRERGKYYRDIYELSIEDIEFMQKKIILCNDKYKDLLKIKFDNFYEKSYYVFEPDGCLYLQKTTEQEDEFIRRII